MRRVNLLTSGPVDVAGLIGAQMIAGRLHALGPGERTPPGHVHEGVEEWALVVAGSPSVRAPDGVRALAEGDVICFPAGNRGARAVDGPGAVLVLSARHAPVPSRPGTGDGPGGPVNLRTVAVAPDPADPAGYRDRFARIGPLLGARQLGATVYELDPGESVCPYHYECTEEEWLFVLRGAPTLRDPEGEHELAPGDAVCFRIGETGAHKVANASAESARVVILSAPPASGVSVCVYPDSGKIGVWPPGLVFRSEDAVGYWEGEA
jgi:uncharacterized cupin superfamily protein